MHDKNIVILNTNNSSYQRKIRFLIFTKLFLILNGVVGGGVGFISIF